MKQKVVDGFQIAANDGEVIEMQEDQERRQKAMLFKKDYI